MKRLVQIYTGDGKGKTTAAFGLAMRACGRGWKVLILQFLKGRESGERIAAEQIDGLEVTNFGSPDFIRKGEISPASHRAATEGFRRAQEAVRSGRFDMVILDEINMAVDFGLIPVDGLVRLMRQRPESVELVLTGRSAHPDLVAEADLVSEMMDIKHPYHAGIAAREGIEY